MTTPPNPPNPRMHVVNPGEKKERSARWDTVQTVALTTLVGLAVAGVGMAGWKLATRRFKKLLRREQNEQDAVAASYQQQPYQNAAGYGAYVPAAAAYYGYAPQGNWAQPNVREQIPDALRDVPQFHVSQPVAPPPVMQPPPVVHAPPVTADPQFRKFMSDLNSRLSAIENHLTDDPADDGDDEDEDEEDERPRRRGGRGN